MAVIGVIGGLLGKCDNDWSFSLTHSTRLYSRVMSLHFFCSLFNVTGFYSISFQELCLTNLLSMLLAGGETICTRRGINLRLLC